MKKIAVIALALCMALTFTGCLGGGGNQGGSVAKLEIPTEKDPDGKDIEIEPELVSDKDFEDNIDGLSSYLEENYCIAGDKIEMSYDVIGADAGYKYVFTYNKKAIQVELYEYPDSNLNALAQTVMDSIKENGMFPVLDKEVKGILSDNEKYIMIYTDADEEEVAAQKERTTELFKVFKAK